MSICDPRDIYGMGYISSSTSDFAGVNVGGSWTDSSGVTYPSYTIYPQINWFYPDTNQPLNPIPQPMEPFVLTPEIIENLKREFEKLYMGVPKPLKLPRKGRMIRSYDE